MPLDAATRRTIVEGEFRALQILCQEHPAQPLWQRTQTLLADYGFRDPLHQLVFDALRALPRSGPHDPRAFLAQHLTRTGFPDVDIDPFFHPHGLSEDLALSILEHLKFTARLDLRA